MKSPTFGRRRPSDAGFIARLESIRGLVCDRDGTLILNVPYLRDPELLQFCSGAEEAIHIARVAGLKMAVVTNQSGIGRGFITSAQVARIQEEIEKRLGKFDAWKVCPHTPVESCPCRKPKPGMVLAAAGAMGLSPSECLVLGDHLTDVEAAENAGAIAVLVPSRETKAEEVRAAPFSAPSLVAAVRLVVDTVGTRARLDVNEVGAS